MRQFHQWLCGPLAGAALVAATPSAIAQTSETTAPAGFRITDQGRVVASQAGSPKIADRLPSSVQMVFEAQPTERGVAVCAQQRVISAGAAEALVRRIAEAEAFYPDFVVAVARRESGFDIAATSRAGAYGLMQLSPETAERFGVDRCDPEENVRGGIRFLRHLWERLRNPFYILAAYNAGEQAVATHRGVPPYPETVAFVAAVISDFYGYPAIGAAPAPEQHAATGSASGPAATSASLTSASLRTGERKTGDRATETHLRTTPASTRRPSQPSSSRQARRTPPAQDWMVLHLE